MDEATNHESLETRLQAPILSSMLTSCHSLFHDALEVITEVSVECVLVEGLVDDLISG